MPGNSPGKVFRKIADVIGRGVVFLVERNQYVGISRAYGSGRVVHIVELAVREADIVGNALHLLTGNLAANRAFDQVAKHRGVFDPRSGLGANMQDELAAVGVREKVLAKPWDERGSRKANQQEKREQKGIACQLTLSATAGRPDRKASKPRSNAFCARVNGLREGAGIFFREV